jgi:hypothetical protein
MSADRISGFQLKVAFRIAIRIITIMHITPVVDLPVIILTEYQSGFRKILSTMDRLVRLESYICEALVCREHIVSVFFDLEMA